MNDIDEEIFDLVEPENVENEETECIRFFELFHDIAEEIFGSLTSLVLFRSSKNFFH